MDLKIERPIDMHLHLRDGEDLAKYAKRSASVFAGALVMPNTIPPIISSESLMDYMGRIMEAAPGFVPHMTFKILPDLSPEKIRSLKEAGAVAGKLYPKGVTTNAEDGADEYTEIYPVLSEMEKNGIILSVHGEDPKAFCLDRETAFLSVVDDIVTAFPDLRIVVEHLSSAAAVEHVLAMPDNVAATITPHHLVLTLDDLIGNSLNPHNFCKPVVKRPEDRAALRGAAVSGNPKFFLGTDSAPHPRKKKESASGAAGIYSSPVAIPLVAHVFHQENALDTFEGFVSKAGRDFYGLSHTDETIVLENVPWKVPEEIDGAVPLYAGREIAWSIRTGE
ncbi:MAG: dihydroorotase [Spirochaetia bacterium]